ncbi:MAG TPA: alpha/beta fold hydrolase [Polyangia bacterium]|nr:alpha/beta fold hydrolase [Polyangia bacterium]
MNGYARTWMSVVFCFLWLAAPRPAGAVPERAVVPVVLKTRDGLTVRGDWRPPPPASQAHARQAAVLLLHQGGSNRHEWDGFIARQLGRYGVLSIDLRGHGESDKTKGPLSALFNDPQQAPEDLRAALEFLRAQPTVDPARIAVIGASIGANLAVVAADGFNIKTAVFLSGKTSAAQNLADKKELRPRSVFYIAGEGDEDGMRARWARELHDLTHEPRRLEILKGKKGHGVTLFKEDLGLEERVRAWLESTL